MKLELVHFQHVVPFSAEHNRNSFLASEGWLIDTDATWVMIARMDKPEYEVMVPIACVKKAHRAAGKLHESKRKPDAT